MGEPERERIVGAWVHAHEEDRPGVLVFRPAGWRLPPSRGRTRFELRDDGSLVEGTIAPTDGIVEATGRWRLAPGGRLELYDPAGAEPRRVLEIVAAAPDRLEVRR